MAFGSWILKKGDQNALHLPRNGDITAFSVGHNSNQPAYVDADRK